MGIRAEWRLADLDLSSDDPFATVILTSGLSVDMSGNEQNLHDGIRQALLLESRLFNQGVTCDLKDGGQDCLTCPEFTADRVEQRAPLCRLGRDQCTLLNRAEEFQRVRFAPYRALASRFQPYAALTEGYSGLLTAVG